MCINSSCLPWGNRTITLFQLCKSAIKELHENHPVVAGMKLLT